MMLRVWAAVLLPIVVLLGWWMSLAFPHATENVIRVRVEGYDPRDLFAGHYITFRVALGGKEPCTGLPNPSNGCVCFKPVDGTFYEADWVGSCSSIPADCSLLWRGTCRNSRFETDVNRYYIPDYYSEVLRTLPPDSSMDLALSSYGVGRVVAMYSGNQTVEEYASQKLAQETSARP